MVRIVSIEASIAAGKSTLIEAIMEKLKGNERYILIPEPVDDWKEIKVDDKDILSCFYSNMTEVALPFQLIALLTRRNKIIEKIKEAKGREKRIGKEVILITERTVVSDRYIFAQMLYESNFISKYGILAYQMWNDEFSKESKTGKIIYLTTPPEVCFNRVKQRARPGEEGITLDYLKMCQRAHDRFYEEHISKNDHKIVDTSNIIKGTSEFNQLVEDSIKYFDLNENNIHVLRMKNGEVNDLTLRVSRKKILICAIVLLFFMILTSYLFIGLILI